MAFACSPISIINGLVDCRRIYNVFREGQYSIPSRSPVISSARVEETPLLLFFSFFFFPSFFPSPDRKTRNSRADPAETRLESVEVSARVPPPVSRFQARTHAYFPRDDDAYAGARKTWRKPIDATRRCHVASRPDALSHRETTGDRFLTNGTDYVI